MDIKITLDTRQVQAALLAAPKAAKAAAVRTLDNTLRKARVAASRTIRETYNVKAGDLTKSVKTSRAKPSMLESRLTITGKPVGLIAFGARQTAKGTTYKILNAGGRARLAHAFIAIMRSGHRGVFDRISGSQMPSKKYNAEKIRERKFIAMPSVWENKKVMDTVHRTINGEVAKEWKVNFSYYFDKWGK